MRPLVRWRTDDLYWLQAGAGGEGSHQVQLIGVVLKLEADGAVPQMPGRSAPVGALELGPLGVVFAAVPGMHAAACA